MTGQKKLRGQTRHRLVGAPSWIGELGGIAPLFYSLPARSTDPENPKLIRKLPRDLLQMIGTPIPRMAFAYGALPPPVSIWLVRMGPRTRHGARREARTSPEVAAPPSKI
jgi:hypothetical protein